MIKSLTLLLTILFSIGLSAQVTVVRAQKGQALLRPF